MKNSSRNGPSSRQTKTGMIVPDVITLSVSCQATGASGVLSETADFPGIDARFYGRTSKYISPRWALRSGFYKNAMCAIPCGSSRMQSDREIHDQPPLGLHPPSRCTTLGGYRCMIRATAFACSPGAWWTRSKSNPPAALPIASSCWSRPTAGMGYLRGSRAVVRAHTRCQPFPCAPLVARLPCLVFLCLWYYLAATRTSDCSPESFLIQPGQ